MLSGAFSAFPMRVVGECVNPGGVDPAIVKVEQCADSDGEIDRLVGPTVFIQPPHVVRCNVGRIPIDFRNEPEQRLVLLIKLGILQVPKRLPYEFLISKQFRRNCGV